MMTLHNTQVCNKWRNKARVQQLPKA